MIALLGNHLWQSTLFAAVAGFLTLTLRRNRAHVRYWLWLAASVKFLVPFAAFVAIGSQIGWLSPPGVQPLIQPDVAVVLDTVGRPFSRSSPDGSSEMAAATVPRGMGSGVPMAIAAVGVVAVVWLGGCGVLVMVWIVGWRRVAATVRRGLRVGDGPELRTLRRLEKIGGIKRPIDVVLSEVPVEPGVFGILRPVLLWPRGIAQHLGDRQVEAILAHEVCHVRRRDNLAAAVHAVVQALFWFHPVVWWVGARLVTERERACDEEVVRLGSDPRVYAESILQTCQLSVASPRVGVAGVGGSDLKKRIEQILASEAAAPLGAWQRLLLGTIGIAAIAVPVAIGMANAPSLRAQAPRPVDHRHRFGPLEVNRLVGFELLPVSPHRPTDDPRGAVAWNVAIDHPSGRISFVGFTGRALIRYAYHLRDLPILDGPGWIDTQSLEMSTSTTAETDDEIRSALRSLLEDRVKLEAHHETRNFPVYALVPAKDDGRLGPNLRRSTRACIDRASLRAGPVHGGVVHDERSARGCGVEDRVTGMTFVQVTMTQLAENLSRSGPMLDRKVVDRTGMTGTFDGALGLGFLPAAAVLTKYPATAALLEPFGVRSVFDALPEQLGLRLVDTTEPHDVLVIDGASPPSIR